MVVYKDNPVLKAIYTRRSVREYTDKSVPKEAVLEIIKAGAWAPSGLNNQPWRFVIVWDRATKNLIAEQTKYARIIREAPVIIAVFIDKTAMYHEIKDYQAIGACLQNMLLAIHALGFGGVWLGEILKNANKVREILDLPDTLQLMAVVALGHPKHRNQISERQPLEDLIVKEI